MGFKMQPENSDIQFLFSPFFTYIVWKYAVLDAESESEHTSLHILFYLLLKYVNLDILFFSHSVFHILCSMEVCDFNCNL